MKNLTNTYSNPKQAVLPLFIQDYLDICDPVLTFDRFMGEIDLEKYLKEITKHEVGRLRYNPVSMLKTILFGFMPYVPDASEQVQDIAENEKRGMRFAGITALVYVLLRNYSVISIKKFLRKNIRTCNIYILTVLSLKPTQTSIPGYGRKRLKNPDTACLRRSLPCFRKLILSFNTRG